MKQYIKNGKIKQRNEIVVSLNGMSTYNPSEEMILADGWEEFVVQPYVPTINDVKRNKKEKITRYDSSTNVNEFFINGISVWIDKATRAGLMLRLQAELAMGKTDTVLWYNGMQFPLTITMATQMLYAIENYASACYDNTQKHLVAIDSLTTAGEIEAYDYHSGYPEKLNFNTHANDIL